MRYHPNSELLNVLRNAYRPCRQFDTYPEAVRNPKCGHIPRGFLRAAAQVSTVEVVMVFAEPGRPHEEVPNGPGDSPAGLLNRGLRQTCDCYRNGADLFHRKVRCFLSELYPDSTFDEQLRRAWLAEGRLCLISE